MATQIMELNPKPNKEGTRFLLPRFVDQVGSV